MAEKKQIVIKVKYPTASKMDGDIPAPKTITVWNFGRIATAAALLLALVAVPLYLLTGDKPDETGRELVANQPKIAVGDMSTQTVAGKTEPAQPTPLVTNKSTAVEPALAPVLPTGQKDTKSLTKPIKKLAKSIVKTAKPKPRASSGPVKNNHIVRALLATDVKKKEPVGELAETVKVSHGKPQTVYFFNEFNGMKGGKMYHEWLLNGKLVNTKELLVADKKWRTSTHRHLTEKSKGIWTVRLKNAQGQVITEKEFKVKVKN